MPGTPPDSRSASLPRQVLLAHVLSGMFSLVALLGGVYYASYTSNFETKFSQAFSAVEKLRAEVSNHLQHSESTELLPRLIEVRNQRGLEYIAVADPRGEAIVHTSPSRIRGAAASPSSTPARWRGLQGTRLQDPTGKTICEFSIPLNSETTLSSKLLLAIREPALWDTSYLPSSTALLFLVTPCVGLVLGGIFLYRLVAPLEGIGQQLARIATAGHGQLPSPSSIEPAGRAAVGWNRLVTDWTTVQSNHGDPSPTLAEVAQLQGDAKTEAVLRSLTEGVAVTDAEGCIRFANRAIEAILGAEGSVEGEALESLLEELAPEQSDSIPQGGQSTEVVAELPVTSAGGERTLRVARVPLADSPQGEHVWNLRDITQQKLAETARDQFIDTATHELRTPLANIKAYAETLASSDFDDVEMQKEFCNTINTEATRLSRFVDDLLSISSLEVGSLAIDRQNVNLRRLLDESIAKVVPLMRSKSIQFNAVLAEKLGEAKVDKDKIAGLLLNLLGNAAKYTPDKGEVTLRATVEEDHLVVEVRDTGVGISEEEQTKVFDKFFRSDNPDVQDQIGTGLGLSLALEIARLHQGDLTVASVLGEGSTFTLTLPV